MQPAWLAPYSTFAMIGVGGGMTGLVVCFGEAPPIYKELSIATASSLPPMSPSPAQMRSQRQSALA